MLPEQYKNKYLDWDGVKFLWSQINMQDYPNNDTLVAVIEAIDKTKADKSEIPSTLPADGGNADSLGGIAASSYLQKAEAAELYQPKGDYASSAQGAKADSALQEITTTADGGLKVTNKNQIDIDSDVVFIFNCGSSTELID